MASTHKPQTKENISEGSPSCLESLGELLEKDMAQVNAIILDKMQSKVTLIPQLASYLIAAGGKRIRPLLMLASTAMFSGDLGRAHKIAACVEFIHSATLLHDDVVDESDQRRGKDSANIVFGNQASVLVGDFLFSKAFQLMVEDGSLEVLKILSDASAIIAQGEVLQLSTTGRIQTSLEDYLEVIESKTAALFAAATQTGPILADHSHLNEKEREDILSAMRSYGLNLGIAFQIVDDSLDYNADTAQFGKSIGDDFKEGKMSAPVIYALQNASSQEIEFWKRVIEDKEQSQDDLQTAMQYMGKHKSFEKSMALAQSYVEKSKEALSGMPENSFKNHLYELSEYVIRRNI